ncbi:3,4-dihydroxy-2-butanone-4-phosphate synthase [Pseudonocardia humida]|uniref:3,4-dihydroxy-2-butanone-4-phosphate synthase n=1 Tax=Pseudonocardia humida TaxID=2800819 RepID=A0ABT0ZY77_9PSEU|nr:3,4-dihydroxy-2-butanone-4-phosphate synthase [Pseudonocardia humida]MCO1655704.1 3,4-dihydroxy-2-butanone-4-phosphate synthase [Pseudonocardia humida]
MSAPAAGADLPDQRLVVLPDADPGPVAAAHRALRRGRPVLLVDDLRDGPAAGTGVVVGGVLVTAAELTGTASMAFLVRETSGVVCVAMTGSRLDELRVPPMDSDGPGASAFAVSVDARVGTTTGISAADRALTARVLADPATRPSDLLLPGHVLPLRVRAAGVLERARPAEAAVDLCRGAGLAPAAVLAAAVDGAGEPADRTTLTALAERHDLVLLAVSDVLADRRRREPSARRGAATALPTSHGRFQAVGYGSTAADRTAPASPGRDEHLALVRGDPATAVGPVLVGVHRECVLGDVFGSLRCGCAARLDAALAAIDAAGRGVLVYLRSGHAFARLAGGANPTGCGAPDERRDLVAADVLRDLGFGTGFGTGTGAVVLLSDDPAEAGRLARCGVAVTARRPLLGAAEADVV